jgi:hypothetical protein
MTAQLKEKIKIAGRKFVKIHGRKPTYRELAYELGLQIETVRNELKKQDEFVNKFMEIFGITK